MASLTKADTPTRKQRRVPTATRQVETDWLREHAKKYEGQWVAIVDDHLYSHGTNAVEVLRRARELGAKSPLIIQIHKGPELPWAGW